MSEESRETSIWAWVIPVSIVGIALIAVLIWWATKGSGSLSDWNQYLFNTQSKYMNEFWPATK